MRVYLTMIRCTKRILELSWRRMAITVIVQMLCASIMDFQIEKDFLH